MSIDGDISLIRSKISEQERINYELRSELNELSVGVDNASGRWNRLSNRINTTLHDGGNRVDDSHSIAVRAYELEGEVEKMYERYKRIELANKKIRECQNKIYYEFANYRAVRKIVEAMLNNIEVSFVSDRTLMKAVEVQHLQLPDYWLTCVLLAIMSWKNDDRTTAQKAVERACELDLKSTSIFLFAFYLRLGRSEPALKWFESYIQCEHTGEDQKDMLLFFSIAAGTLGEKPDVAVTDAAENYIRQLVNECIASAGFNEEMVVAKIMACLNMYRVSGSMNYPVLSKYCTEKDFLLRQLNAARTNLNYLEMLARIKNVSDEEKRNYLNSFMDDVVKRANLSEKNVRNEILKNEYIISHQGDTQSAERAYNDYLEHNRNKFDIINEMTDWIYHPTDDTGAAERKNMFTLSKNFHFSAIEKKVKEYRSRCRKNFNIKIGEYESNADFSNPSQEISKIEAHYKQKEQTLLSNVKLLSAFVMFGIALLAVIGAVMLRTPVMFVLAAGGIFGGVMKIILSSRLKEKIIKDCEIEAQNTKDAFAQILGDFENYEREFSENDSRFDDIKAEFGKI